MVKKVLYVIFSDNKGPVIQILVPIFQLYHNNGCDWLPMPPPTLSCSTLTNAWLINPTLPHVKSHTQEQPININCCMIFTYTIKIIKTGHLKSSLSLTLKAPITTAITTAAYNIFSLFFRENKT